MISNEPKERWGRGFDGVPVEPKGGRAVRGYRDELTANLRNAINRIVLEATHHDVASKTAGTPPLPPKDAAVLAAKLADAALVLTAYQNQPSELRLRMIDLRDDLQSEYHALLDPEEPADED